MRKTAIWRKKQESATNVDLYLHCSCLPIYSTDFKIILNVMFKESYQSGLSAGTVITKETKEPDKRVPLQRALYLLGFILSFVVRNLCLGTYRRSLSISCGKIIL